MKCVTDRAACEQACIDSRLLLIDSPLIGPVLGLLLTQKFRTCSEHGNYPQASSVQTLYTLLLEGVSKSLYVEEYPHWRMKSWSEAVRWLSLGLIPQTITTCFQEPTKLRQPTVIVTYNKCKASVIPLDCCFLII